MDDAVDRVDTGSIPFKNNMVNIAVKMRYTFGEDKEFRRDGLASGHQFWRRDRGWDDVWRRDVWVNDGAHRAWRSAAAVRVGYRCTQARGGSVSRSGGEALDE